MHIIIVPTKEIVSFIKDKKYKEFFFT